MIIAMTSTDSKKDALLDPRLGRCSIFAFYDSENDHWSFLPNPGALQGSGAGVKAAQFLIEQNAGVLLTGELGPKASQILNGTEIKVYSLPEIPLTEALAQYLAGKAKEISKATVRPHAGMNRPT